MRPFLAVAAVLALLAVAPHASAQVVIAGAKVEGGGIIVQVDENTCLELKPAPSVTNCGPLPGL